jgi:hypothetical protein
MNRQGNAVNIFLAIALSLGAVFSAQAQTSPDERGARDAVASFYSAFNAHDFGRAAEFTTDDWNTSIPGAGGRAAGNRCSPSCARCMAAFSRA